MPFLQNRPAEMAKIENITVLYAPSLYPTRGKMLFPQHLHCSSNGVKSWVKLWIVAMVLPTLFHNTNATFNISNSINNFIVIDVEWYAP